jgi:hypothetical protein
MKLKVTRQLIVMLLIISPITINFQNTFAQDIQPIHIHLTWQHDTETTITISWRTFDKTSSIVQYGIDDSYGTEETGDETAVHHVELIGLNPDTVYHYRVGNGEVWSDDHTFKTGTSENHARFIAWGDSRHNRPERRAIMNTVNSLDFDFSVFDGDFVDSGLDGRQWLDWFDDFSPLLSHKPFMSVLGNHESNSSHFYNYFSYPGKEEYYSFNYGPIHFICLHSCVPYYGVTFDEQINWLLNDLETYKDYDWKIVVQHRPAYSSSERNHEGDYDDIQTLLVPIYEEHNITMVISGHDHWYERLQKNNITYVVAGAAGAPLYTIDEAYRIPESVYSESTHHAVLIEIFENQLDMRAFRIDRTIMDQYTINRVDKPDLRCNNLPTTYNISKGQSQNVTISIMNIGEVDILEETKAKVEISNGETWNITVPPLNVYESVDFKYEWTAPDNGMYTWTVTTDIGNQIDEVVEDNNQAKFYFDAIETEKTGFFVKGIWVFIAALGTIIITALIKKRKN